MEVHGGAHDSRCESWGFFPGTAWEKQTEPADKPGFVVDSHSSRRIVTDTLKQPTRRHRGPRHCLPIWSCSRWGLPCRSVAGLAVRSYRTISPLPRIQPRLSAKLEHLVGHSSDKRPEEPFGGIFLLHFPSACAAQGLPGTVPCEARTFLGINIPKNAMTRLPGRLRRNHCRTRTCKESLCAPRIAGRNGDRAGEHQACIAEMSSLMPALLTPLWKKFLAIATSPALGGACCPINEPKPGQFQSGRSEADLILLTQLSCNQSVFLIRPVQ